MEVSVKNRVTVEMLCISINQSIVLFQEQPISEIDRKTVETEETTKLLKPI